MRRQLAGLFALTAITLFPNAALAQDAAPVTFPDFLELDGANGLYLLPDPEFSVLEGGTIEFWVEPDWTEAPDYDPVILSAAGPSGASYVIAMLAEKDGIGLISGDQGTVWAFNFDDDQVHHVALNFYDGAVAAIIDGEPRGLIEMEMADLAPSGVWIGTADGNTAPFVGAIASLRIWGVPVEPEVLDTFRYFDVLADDTELHPDIDYLQVISDFNDTDVLIVEGAVESAGEEG